MQILDHFQNIFVSKGHAKSEILVNLNLLRNNNTIIKVCNDFKAFLLK
jgi:hypothetical protein